MVDGFAFVTWDADGMATYVYKSWDARHAAVFAENIPEFVRTKLRSYRTKDLAADVMGWDNTPPLPDESA